MGFSFGSKSLEKLKTCHLDLQKVMELALSRSKIDFGISEGHRDVATQQSYYAIGRTVDKHKRKITNVDGVNKKGKHNYNPSLAVDIYAYHSSASTRKQIAFNNFHLSYIAGVIDSCAQELKKAGKISSEIIWGGNWDNDGIIQFDQNLNDMPHFEIK